MASRINMKHLLAATCVALSMSLASCSEAGTAMEEKPEGRFYFQGTDFTINLWPLVIALKVLFIIGYLVTYYFGEEGGEDYGYVGTTSSGYGAPATGSGYAAPAESSGYAAPAASYAAPAQSYSNPAPSYSAPTPSYNVPSPSYAAPAQQSYNAPSSGYATPHLYASRKGLDSTTAFVQGAVAKVQDWLTAGQK